jgi:hypothetical protein
MRPHSTILLLFLGCFLLGNLFVDLSLKWILFWFLRLSEDRPVACPTCPCAPSLDRHSVTPALTLRTIASGPVVSIKALAALRRREQHLGIDRTKIQHA